MIYRRTTTKRIATSRAKPLVTYKRPRRYATGGMRTFGNTSRSLKSVPQRVKRKVRVNPKLRAAIKLVADRKTETKLLAARTALGATIGSTFQTYILNGILGGTGVSQRVGEWIESRGVRVAYMFKNATPLTTYVRMFITKGRVKGANLSDSSPIFTDRFGDSKSFTDITTVGIADTDQIISYKLDSVNFTIIWDKIFKLGPATEGKDDTRFVNTWVPLAGKVKYDDATGTAATTSNVYNLTILFFQPGAASIGAATLTYSGHYAFYYKDA